MIESDGLAIGDEEVRLLARLAGLQGDDAHLRALARELEATLGAARELDAAVSRAGTLEDAPFDPAWTGPGGRR